jgi:hypothetical protein
MDQEGIKILQQRIDNRRRIMALGITPWHMVMDDDYIEYMAERFLLFRIRQLTHLSFEQYLESPENCERCVDALKSGGALQFESETPWQVSVLN